MRFLLTINRALYYVDEGPADDNMALYYLDEGPDDGKYGSLLRG